MHQVIKNATKLLVIAFKNKPRETCVLISTYEVSLLFTVMGVERQKNYIQIP